MEPVCKSGITRDNCEKVSYYSEETPALLLGKLGCLEDKKPHMKLCGQGKRSERSHDHDAKCTFFHQKDTYFVPKERRERAAAAPLYLKTAQYGFFPFVRNYLWTGNLPTQSV